MFFFFFFFFFFFIFIYNLYILQFLKEQNITAHEAEQLNIVQYLLYAPKKQREKYGKRKPISKEEKLAVQKERNREHARATRERQKLFKMVCVTELSIQYNGNLIGVATGLTIQSCHCHVYLPYVYFAL